MMPTFFTSPTNYFVLSYHMYANQFLSTILIIMTNKFIRLWTFLPIRLVFPRGASETEPNPGRQACTNFCGKVYSEVCGLSHPNINNGGAVISTTSSKWGGRRFRIKTFQTTYNLPLKRILPLFQQFTMTTLTTTKCSNCSSYSAPHSLTATASNQHVGCLTISAIINTCWRYAVIAGKSMDFAPGGQG